MKRKPIVSIIMPMYNQENYMEQCLNTVTNQTLKDIEIIIVNDGSTDRSLEIVNDAAKKDERIIVIDKPNSGYGNSVNRGLKRATGDYVGIVETDDYVSLKMFETLYNLSNNGTVEIVKGNFYDVYEHEDGTFEKVVNNERKELPDIVGPFTIRQYPQILWGHPSVWSAIYKRDFLNKHEISFMELPGGGWVDNPFFFETLCKAESIVWTKEPFYFYGKSNPVSSSNSILNPNLPFDRMNDNLDVLERNKFTDDITLKYAYARSLMYLNGAFYECDYTNNYDLINLNAKELFQRCEPQIFSDYFNMHDQYQYTKYASPLRTITNKFPRILIYNWAPYDNLQKHGGGVTLYCKNLISAIIKDYPTAQIYFLSSGYVYEADKLHTYIRKIDSIYGERCYQYEIVNSPVPAPQSNILLNPLVAIENSELKSILKEFITSHGPFQAMHFNNIEGLSLDVLDLKQDFPKTKFIYSLHNYVPICLTGFYYQRHNHCICNPSHTNFDCINCINCNYPKDIAENIYKVAKFNANPKKLIEKKQWVSKFKFDKLDKQVSADNILDFAKTAVHKINKNCDKILAVSKRVYDIAKANGLNANKMSVSYIGTRVANHQVGKSISPVKERLKILFLGNDLHYKEKGYPFLLNALEKLDPKYSSKIDLVLTVKPSQHPKYIYAKLKNFNSVKVIQGYTHSDLQRIFDGCNLSIIPVLWEDNLPQISIESVAFGVPVLASSFGGASELCSDPAFSFKGGDTKDFLDKIIFFVEHPEYLKNYWESHKGLTTMSKHIKEMIAVYELPPMPESLEISTNDFHFLMMENQFLHHNFLLNRNAFPSTSLRHRLINKIKKLCPEGTRRREFLKACRKMVCKK